MKQQSTQVGSGETDAESDVVRHQDEAKFAEMQESRDQRTVKHEATEQGDLGQSLGKSSSNGEYSTNLFVNAEKQRLRVGAAWGMPGLYASDGGNRDLVLGTTGGKKVYFGIGRNDAWIQAGTGHMWLKGSATVKNYGHFFAEGQRLRVGAAWGMPGIYASDGKNRDMVIGTAAGKKIYFGIKTNDAWIQAGTGHMWLKGKVTANMNSHFKAGGKVLRVGAAWGMPGIYASDGGAEDLVLGTKSGRRVYFGVSKQNAWIQAGTGHMWIKGSLTSENNAYVIAEKQKLRVGSVWGMPGLYASDGEARDLVLGTKKGRKVYFGEHKGDAWIQAGTGNAWFKGGVRSNANLDITVAGQRLRVGSWGGMPGLYSSDDAPRDLMLGTAKGRKVYMGASNSEAYFTAGLGSLWLKGSLETHNNAYIYAENNRLRVGSVWGIPGIYSSDGGARDLMLGTAKNFKVFFGNHREDAWIQGGTGQSYFKGAMTVTDNIKVSKNGQALRVGEVFGMPGIFSSDGVSRDLMLGAANGKKVYFGYARDNAYVTSGTGDAWFKGTATAGNLVASNQLTVKKAAFFEDTVTVKKNLILQTGESVMDLAEEMRSVRSENAELKAMVAEMRSEMEAMRRR